MKKHSNDKMSPSARREFRKLARTYLDSSRNRLDELDRKLRQIDSLDEGTAVPPAASHQAAPAPAPNWWETLWGDFWNGVNQWLAEGDAAISNPVAQEFLEPVETRGPKVKDTEKA